LLDKEFIEIDITNNYRYYESLGYIIPKYIDLQNRLKVKKGTKIFVKIDDIPHGSNISIPVVCDYCEESYSPKIQDYYIGHKTIKKDACGKCTNKKIKDVYMFKYNTTNYKIINEIKGYKYNIGHIKINFDIVYNEFLNHGLLLQIDETEFNKINIRESLPFICSEHKEYGIQYKTYNKVKNSKFCCEYGYRNQNKGENHPKWKGGISSERDKVRQTNEYKEWRENVFKRDNYICQCCGDNKGGNLNAHHILNFSDYIELRFDVNNGITLCDKCHNLNKHGSFHHTYGTKNNTKEQLEEYIQRYKSGEFDELRKTS